VERGASERRWIVLFDSTHYVLAAERVFREHGVRCDLVPVPRSLSADCGMAIEFLESDVDTVKDVLADRRVRPQGVYRPGGESGHKAVSI
jgi:hypothetical protein